MSKRGYFKSMLFLGVSIAAVVSFTTTHQQGVTAGAPQAAISRLNADALTQTSASHAADAAQPTVAPAAKPAAQSAKQTTAGTEQTSTATTSTTSASTKASSQAALPKENTQATTKAAATAKVTPTAHSAARMITMGGVSIHYIIGNESMGAAPASGASTWGGQAHYSNNSGQNTHFIGHNPGSFAVLTSLGIGSAIRVTDGNGVGRTYHVYQIAKVNPSGVTASHQDLWNQITGTGGGQRITLQTCLGSYWREIVFAR